MRVGLAVQLPDDASHHITRVLRLRIGAELTLFDGSGGEYRAELIEGGKHAVARVTAFDPIDRESACNIVLAQSLATGDKMDWVVQKAVELGVAAVQPVASERSVLRLQGDRAERRVLHWQQVVQSACEQCGRNVVPQVLPIVSLREWLGQLPVREGQLRAVLTPGCDVSLSNVASPGRDVLLLVGPEGGLSDSEQAAAQACGFVTVGLGPRVLRTETAGAAAISTWLARHGEF